MTSGRPRIVSLLPAATEIVCEIGLRDQLVGVSHACNWPPGLESLPRVTRSRVDSSAGSHEIDAQVAALFAAGEPLYEFDSELLAALRPTLVITQSQCDVCAVSLASVVDAVAASPALAETEVLALHPQSIFEVLTDVVRIGEAAGAADSAGKLAASLRRRIDAVQQARAGYRGPRLRIVVIEWTDPLMAAGNWTPEQAELAGGQYGLVAPGQASAYVDWPTIAAYQPEVVVVAPCGFDLERSHREARRLESLPGWKSVPASTAGRVEVVDGDAYFNRPGPRLVDSLELLDRLMRLGLEVP